MPRPTPAQIAYGSATVVLSTLALLLASQARAGLGIAVVALVSLALGLFVAHAVAQPRPAGRGVRQRMPAASARRAPVPAETRVGEARVGEHSLHG